MSSNWTPVTLARYGANGHKPVTFNHCRTSSGSHVWISPRVRSAGVTATDRMSPTDDDSNNPNTLVAHTRATTPTAHITHARFSRRPSCGTSGTWPCSSRMAAEPATGCAAASSCAPSMAVGGAARARTAADTAVYTPALSGCQPSPLSALFFSTHCNALPG